MKSVRNMLSIMETGMTVAPMLKHAATLLLMG